MKLKYIIPIVLLVVILISGCGPQTTLTPSFSTADFAKCLTDKGIKVYGASWCGHCDAQKELFGEAWSSIDYVECSIPGSESEIRQICIDAGIRGLPTWKFNDGNILMGKQSLLELSQASGCPVPSGPIQQSESKIIFVGPQQTLQTVVNQQFPGYSFCKPDVDGSGATCGGLEGATSDPTGGKPPYSFEAKGILPSGLTLNLNGLLTGTPALEGTYDFQVCAKDLYENEACIDVTFEVSKEDVQIPEEVVKEPVKYAGELIIESNFDRTYSGTHSSSKFSATMSFSDLSLSSDAVAVGTYIFDCSSSDEYGTTSFSASGEISKGYATLYEPWDYSVEPFKPMGLQPLVWGDIDAASYKGRDCSLSGYPWFHLKDILLDVFKGTYGNTDRLAIMDIEKTGYMGYEGDTFQFSGTIGPPARGNLESGLEGYETYTGTLNIYPIGNQ